MLVNFKLALAVRGVQQNDLAAQLCISQAKLSEIVNERQRCKPDLQERIARLLDADPRWLFNSTCFIPKLLDSVPPGSVAVR